MESAIALATQAATLLSIIALCLLALVMIVILAGALWRFISAMIEAYKGDE